MKKIYLYLATAVTCLLLTVSQTGLAQNSATVQATATVLEPVTITSSMGMHFGDDILPGISRSILRTEASAAKFSFTAVGGTYVSYNFTLPDMLIHETTGEELPIVFGPTDASRNIDDVVNGSTVFDPNVESSQMIVGAGNDMFIWLGGTIHPRSNQTAGLYSGDITIDLTYTEN